MVEVSGIETPTSRISETANAGDSQTPMSRPAPEDRHYHDQMQEINELLWTLTVVPDTDNGHSKRVWRRSRSSTRGLYGWRAIAHRSRCLTTIVVSSVACVALSGASFRDSLVAQFLTHKNHRTSTFRRAQKFPEAASRRMSLSRAMSATSFFRRAFSFSSSRSFLA